uniref:DUF3615 domain-containing protein n=1 Tax=Leersia perrieri TaxID=77586 RepID=A0A0D9VXT3_9ORYZ
MARKDHAERSMLGLDRAYMVAATAAYHPDPNALVKFFLSAFPIESPPPQTHPFMFQAGGILDVQLLVDNLMRYCPSSGGSVQTVPVLSEEASMLLSCIQEEFKSEQSFICGKVNDALKKYNQQTTVCRVMDLNMAGIDSDLSILTSTSWRVQEICILLREFPYFFFAECRNKEDVMELTCCPVMGHPGRCFHCEREGAKIVHPDLEKYTGRINFLEMACDKSSGITAEGLLGYCEYVLAAVDICEDDCVCFDASRDAKCAEFLNFRGACKARLG